MLAAAIVSPTALLTAYAQDAETLRQAEPPANAIWLETLDLRRMTAGYGSARRARSIDNNPLTLGGIVYPHGVGTHAPSVMGIDLGGGATRFEAMVGVDDEKSGHGSVVFEVHVDGKKVADSGVLKGGDAPKPISVDLTGAKRLVLLVEDAGDGIDSDHADWAGALIVLNPAAGVRPKAVALGTDEPARPIYSYKRTMPEPAIHGPRVTGATPGRPFLFLIPATGEGPLTYGAENLPAGLTLDSRTGVISGSLKASGTTVARLTVRGPRGLARRNLSIVAGEHKLAQTPPMGWNSWNIFYCDVDEQKVRDAADWLVKTGLDRHGYQYVNIDDCWQGPRDASGEVTVNQKFGDLKALGDYIHSKGLKFGIYSSPGPLTCASHTGSYQHERQDAAAYARWGVDYLKHDWCSYGGVATGEGRERFKKPYRVMREALDTVDRDIVYSLCQYGMGDVWEWGADPDIAADLWRTTGDIGPSWSSMANIGFGQNGLEKHAGPGRWNDPDMLFLHALSPNEQITHMTLWSLLAAPLLIGSDISKLSQFTIDALSNDEVIEIDQDPLGKQASRRAKEGSHEVWARPLWDGTTAVGLFNRGYEKADVTARWSDIGISGPQPLRDLWQHRDLGVFRDAFTVSVPAHGAVLVKIGRPRATDYQPQP